MIDKAGFAEDFTDKAKDRQVSASQLKTYKGCNRQWGFKYLDKLPDPPGPGARFGLEVHKEYENFFRDGTAPNPSTRAGRLAQRGLESGHYPDPACVSGVEPHIMFEVGGVRFHGFVDLLSFVDVPGMEAEPRTIHDHKTSSDPKKYALTAETLKKDEQGLIYGTWGLAAWGNPVVSLQWTYHGTRTKALFPVRAEMERDETYRDFEQHCLIPAQALLRDRKKHKTGNDLPVNLSQCSEFGGCKFSAHCHRTTEQIIQAADTSKEGTNTMGLKDLLAKNKGKLAPPRASELVTESGPRVATTPLEQDYPQAAPPRASEIQILSQTDVTTIGGIPLNDSPSSLAEATDKAAVAVSIEARRINPPEGPSNVETQRAVSRVVETTGGGPKAAKQTNRAIAVAAQGEGDPNAARDKAETVQREAQADGDARKASSLTTKEAIRICLKDPEGIAIFSGSKPKATALHPYYSTRGSNKAAKEGLVIVVDRDDGLKSVTVTAQGKLAVGVVSVEVKAKDAALVREGPVQETPTSVSEVADTIVDSGHESNPHSIIEATKTSWTTEVESAFEGSHARFLQRLLNNEKLNIDDVKARYATYCASFPEGS